MRRAMAVLLAGAMLAGCPSTRENTYSRDATAERAADVGDEGAAGDGDVADADVTDADVADADVADADAAIDADVRDVVDAGADAPEVQMTIEFGSVALHGESDGGVRMRASVTWHHVPRSY